MEQSREIKATSTYYPKELPVAPTEATLSKGIRHHYNFLTSFVLMEAHNAAGGVSNEEKRLKSISSKLQDIFRKLY